MFNTRSLCGANTEPQDKSDTWSLDAIASDSEVDGGRERGRNACFSICNHCYWRNFPHEAFIDIGPVPLYRLISARLQVRDDVYDVPRIGRNGSNEEVMSLSAQLINT
ncbi:hypothetical protein KIN20_009934 [Parelaphostrongylus tenuis]|uniref:Uncharacterized protein n=1 Tax=Parelaphostrongylus tenuis TaxID=148309 RepID=A0AAD5MBV3_PARTN|nr:hypothetical protein KIN20_009934 [Parelaphostrongylus tenuis]